MILSQFPYPMTVTMVQLTSIAVWSIPMLKVNTLTITAGHCIILSLFEARGGGDGTNYNIDHSNGI